MSERKDRRRAQLKARIEQDQRPKVVRSSREVFAEGYWRRCSMWRGLVGLDRIHGLVVGGIRIRVVSVARVDVCLLGSYRDL